MEAAILNLFESKIAPLDPPSSKTPPYNKHEVDRTTGCGDMAIQNYQDGGPHLQFVRIENSVIRSPVLENPTL